MNLKKTTLPQVIPYLDSNMEYLEEQVPSYLNTACLPFVQQYYTLDNLESIKYQNAGTRTKSYYEFDAYMSALRDDEERKYLIRFT